LNLQNSTDAKIIENLEKENKKKQDLLNQTINLLGPADIKNLTDLELLLAGQSLKELKQSYQHEINKLASNLDQIKEKLQFYTENLKTKESIISEYQQEIKQKDLNYANLHAQHEELTQAKELLSKKTSDQELALLNLAKQKLANQKQAQILVKQIEAQ